MTIKALIGAAALSLTLVACAEPTTPAQTSATVEISGLYVIAPAPGRDVAGGGMNVTATGGDYRLVSISSEAADRVEMHTMEMQDDMMKMNQVDGYDIADGETLELAPGGPHLMLFGFDETLAPGDTAEMLFTFEDASGNDVTLNYPAAIKGIGED